MGPLAAFQMLVLTVAAAMAVEAFKVTGLKRIAFWVVFGIASLIGLFSNAIADAWPAASSAMILVGSSVITWWLLSMGIILFVQFSSRPSLTRSPGLVSDSAPPAAPADTSGLADQVAALARQEKDNAQITGALVEASAARSVLELLTDFKSSIGLAEKVQPVVQRDDFHGRVESAARFLIPIQSWCQRMGWPYYDQFLQDREHHVASVKGDAINCLMGAGDEKKWQSGQHKQNWLVKRAELGAMRRLTQLLESQLREKLRLLDVRREKLWRK